MDLLTSTQGDPNVRRRVLTGLAALCLIGAFGAPALAQQTATGDAPTYARPSYASDEESIHGRIASVTGRYDLQVRDDRGFIDSVSMHQGTVINPTGLALAPGMSVTILGRNRGRVFAANEIDTPYLSYPYLGYGPYPVYPYGVYVEPSFGFRFGGGRRR